MGFWCWAFRRRISSLIMPACTGLPPGESIISTRAREPWSSSALRMAAMMNSAFAFASLAMAPLISTTAVCGPLIAAVALSRPSHQNVARKAPSQAKRQKMRQRRAARCSRTVANTRRSSTSRSQPGAAGAAACGAPDAARAHRSCPGCGSDDGNPSRSGVDGVLMGALFSKSGQNGSMPARPQAAGAKCAAQALLRSHWCKSATSAATCRGWQACRSRGSCAP